MSDATIYAYKYRGGRRNMNLPFWLDRKPALDRQSTEWVGPFTDLTTGRLLMFRSADCGSPCHCAAEWRLITKRERTKLLQALNQAER